MIGTFRKIVVAVLSAFVMVACVDNDPFSSYNGDSVNVTFSATLDNGNHGSRSGESGTSLDVTHMRYQVFTSTMQSGSITETFTPTAVSDEIAIDGSQVNINVDFVKNQRYRIVFLAYNKQKSETENYPYVISDDLTSLSVDYSKYTAGHELFYAVTGTLQIDASGNLSQAARTVTLKRPYATISLSTDDETEEYVSETVNVIFTNDLYTSLDLTTGYPTAEGAVKTLSAVVDKETTSSMTVNNKPVYKFASFNVLTHPNDSENIMSFTLAEDGVEKTDIPVTLSSNYLVKVAGDIVEVRAWDGVTFTAPKVTPDKCSVTGYALHVETPDQLAHLLTYGTTETSIHICNDMDMGGHALNAVAYLPEGATISGLNADGERKHIIFNLRLDNVGGLFGGVANDLKINNLEIGGVTLNSNSVNNAGVLLGKATGTLEMTNVTVDSCTVNGSRNVGGMVGYIDGNATFTGCVSKNVTTNAADDPGTISASTDYKTTGAMVGVFKGNTAEETLTFDADCSVEGYTTGAGAYVAQNQSCWVEGTLDAKYDNALGNEEFCRGTVTYGGVRIVPHWDGIRRVAPITENGVILINSPFDLANLQRKDDNQDNTTYASVKFVTDVDMASEIYEPIYKITNLDGNYKTLYGLKVDTKHRAIGSDLYGGGLMRVAGGGTHKNFTINGADVKVLHEESTGNAYAGVLSASVSASQTIQNVHIKNSKLYAVCKMGGLVGRVTGGTFNCIGCTVDNCVIENYDSNVYEVFGKIGSIECGFYSQGECGGLIGYISHNANITNCSVTNTVMSCIGQDNWMAVVPGRHVNQFIGDIKPGYTDGVKYNVVIDGYTVSGNTYASGKRKDHYRWRTGGSLLRPVYTEIEIIGCAYVIDKIAGSDGIGTVTVKKGDVVTNVKIFNILF